MAPTLSVVLPVYNERDNLEDLLARLLPAWKRRLTAPSRLFSWMTEARTAPQKSWTLFTHGTLGSRRFIYHATSATRRRCRRVLIERPENPW